MVDASNASSPLVRVNLEPPTGCGNASDNLETDFMADDLLDDVNQQTVDVLNSMMQVEESKQEQ